MHEKLRKEAKRYIEEIYSNHKQDDIEAWNRLIDVLFICFSEMIKKHEEDKHG